MIKMEEKGSESVKSGFRKNGIVPFNLDQVLKRIPDKNELVASVDEISKNVDGSLIELLDVMKGSEGGQLCENQRTD